MFKSVFKTGIRGTYAVSEQAAFSTDLWLVYPAKHKQNGKAVSVFIFDKPRFESLVNQLCNQSRTSVSSQQIISECYSQFRTQVQNLTKMKHPQILTVLEVLEETKLKFIFATEPVAGTLATADLSHETDLTIQKGLLEVSKGLQFLHNHCLIIHLNVQPSSVFVTAHGDWKLAGFAFLQNLNELSPLDRENFFIVNNSQVADFANHNLNFTAPELLLDSFPLRLSTANDVWSLGLLIYYLYNQGDLLINCFESYNLLDFKTEFRKFESRFYGHRAGELGYLFKKVPESLWPTMTQLLARYPNDRPSIDQFIDLDFFNDSLIKMMWFIDEFATKSVDEKIVFLNGLLEHVEILEQLPTTFRNSKLLPLLTDAIKSELQLLPTKKWDQTVDSLVSKALQLVFSIGGGLSNLSFQDRVYEELLRTSAPRKGESDLMKLAKTSVKTRLAIVGSTEILLQKLSEAQVVEIMKAIANECVTFLKNTLDSQADQIQLQDMFLQKLHLVVTKFDFPYVKNTFMPLLCLVFKTTTVLSTKIETIKTFSMLIDKKVIDKVIVAELLLPLMENLKSRDKRVVKEVLAFFVSLSTSQHIVLDLEILVDKVLSQSLRLVFACNECSQTEFEEFMRSVNSIQNTAVKSKMSSLHNSASPATQGSDNFSSLINKASIRTLHDEDRIKVPALSPQTPTTSQSRPMKLTAGMPVARQSPRPASGVASIKTEPLALNGPLRFGATSSSTFPAMSPTLTSSYTPAASSSNLGLRVIDWSAALLSPAPSSSVMQPTSTGPVPPAKNTPRYPPGYSGQVLTPGSGSVALTNTSLPMPKATNSELLDFL